MDTDQDRSDRRVRTNCLLILTVIGVGLALWQLRPVLVPFCLALLLTYCLRPVIDFQVKFLRLPPTLALVGAGVAGLVILLLLGYLTAASVGQFAGNIEGYHEQLRQLTEKTTGALDRLGIKISTGTGGIFTVTENAGRQLLTAFLTATTDLISTAALVAIFMIFFLLGSRGLSYDRTSLLGEIEAGVRRYVVRLVGLSALTGLLVGVLLGALGVEFALVFGFLTFLLNFIPNVGAIIATLIPLPVILLSPNLSVAEQVLAVVAPGAIQFVIGSVIQPRFYGEALELHPVTVLMALIFFGTIWGMIGAFLAMPITGVIRIIVGRIPATRSLAALMAGDLGILARPTGPPAAKSADVATQRRGGMSL